MAVYAFTTYDLDDATTGYGMAFVIWASVSLAIDTAIASIMIWSVREI